MSELRFDGRVVIVTGAGGGLGKVYALFFASRGASVVVNDLGGSRAGDGSGNHKAADLVVNEIVAAGGKAVSNYDSVEDGDKIVATAVKAFGKVDIVINNAGILRDKSFSRMTDDDWDLIQRVHVRGSYKVAKAAWDIFQKQGFGRIINTTSAAGIYGNFGQANYAAAKYALHGFTLTLAKEGEKKNIFCNSIAPLAASRMTETVLPPDMLAHLNPTFVVPVVAYLCHEKTTENGGLFEVGAGFVSKLRFERSKGVMFKADATFTPGSVATQIAKIGDFSKEAQYPTTIAEVDWVGLLDEAKKLKTNAAGPNLRFDGRVVVVTGAGQGLGRAYAHLFAKNGASVVVNDLGTSHTGSGAAHNAADTVVNELRALGAKAVANYDSVEDGDKVIETAIKAFGRVDIVINNAGILRDKSFARATDADWDLVHRVHLRGTYKILKAAWPHFMKQKYGRIINTTSAVGLYGNFGQANYSAAKAGVIALSNTLALEGRKSNIIVNTIAPNAGTRMTATVMPPEIVEALKPDYIAPPVAFLCHESNTEHTGGVYEVGSGWVSKVRIQRTGGYGFPVNVTLTPEHVAAKWNVITNFEDGRATYPTTTQESFMAVTANFENIAKDVPAEKPAAASAGKEVVFAPVNFEYTERDVILYALGVNAKRTELNLVYENADPFVTIPSFAVCVGFNSQMQVPFGDLLPNFNPMMLLHGEQFVRHVKPLPVSGKFVNTAKIVEIVDKGKSAVMVIGVTTKDAATGEVYCENEYTNFIRGSGGFGGPSKSIRTGAAVAANEPPKRPADVIVIEKTPDDLAALYRLSGDYNPLHIDPQMAAMGGFKVPILHGLCSYGIACRTILREFGGNDPASFKTSKVRFAKHFFPGETAEIHMWKEGATVIFEVRCVERNAVVISNAAVELRGEWAKKPAPSKAKL
ncbi:NAD(P)-binding protein [Rhizoclosmatium globosum]|uniref:Peroxisomal hydratase-dehydrogenase-epimerase n=1 Tax=Rhizoclosmatium globosum TaxID=329046 RepID=A0A1Y2B0W8_9FUNG|nr:NAD(P)-binding protein [Rhizoclosmatium globosum]|eukprot:ORY28376.1 NAD(P)-binding protein [Rhizoclosmatium globosum]